MFTEFENFKINALKISGEVQVVYAEVTLPKALNTGAVFPIARVGTSGKWINMRTRKYFADNFCEQLNYLYQEAMDNRILDELAIPTNQPDE